MWSEAARSLVPALPPISTAGSGSRSRHSSQSSMVLRNKLRQAENGSRMVSNSVEDFEYRAASSRELDCKVAELFTELSRLRAIVGHLEAERTNKDVWLKESFVHVRDQMSWLSQKVDNTLNTLANKVEQLKQQAATEHAQLLTMAVEQSKKGVWEYSNKMKNSLQEQMSSLDKVFQKEHASLISYTTQLEDKLSGQLTNIQSQFDSLKADIEKERTRYGSQLAGLSSSLSVVGRNCKESKEELSSVISIEIRTRQSEVAKAQSEYQKLHGLCRTSISSVREGLISLEERLASDKKEAHLLSDKLCQEWHGMNQRMQADVSARLTALHNHINSVSSTHKLSVDSSKEDCESKSPSHVTRIKSDKQGERKKVMTDVSGQAAVNGTSYDHTIQATEMESLQKEIECQSSQVSKLASSLHDFQVWVVGAMQRESGERCQSDFELTKEISNVRAQLSMALTALNAPYSNGNAHLFEPSYPACYPHPDTHFRTDRRIGDLNSNHAPYHDANHKQNTPGLDNVVTDRPAGATTTAFSPFPEGRERRPYMSNVESETETESDGDTILIEHHKFDTPATLPESPLLQYQVAQLTSSDPLETSLESHSGLSSASELPQLQYNTKEFPLPQRQPQGHTMNQRRQFFHLQHVQDVPETNGRFTSASATPDSQKKVSLTDKIKQESDLRKYEEEQSKREGPLEQEEDLKKANEKKLERKPVGVRSDHVRDKADEQAKDENSGRNLSESHTIESDNNTIVVADGVDKSKHPVTENNTVLTKEGNIESENDSENNNSFL